jgi:hypothetical protein
VSMPAVGAQRLQSFGCFLSKRPAPTGETEGAESRVLEESEQHIDLRLAAAALPGRHPALLKGWRAHAWPMRRILALSLSITGMPGIAMPSQPQCTGVGEKDVYGDRSRGDTPGVAVDMLWTSAKLLGDVIKHQGLVGGDAPGCEDLRAVAEQGGVVEATDNLIRVRAVEFGS